MQLNKPNNLIGLDLGTELIKLLKINSYSSPCKVEFFEMAAMPANAVVKGEFKDLAAIADLLKSLVKKVNLTDKNFALAIPRSSTITKNITIDSRLSEDDIESRVWIEAKNHFPELVGDIYLDFSIIGPSAQDPNQLDLILVACRKDILKPRLEILNMAGVTPRIVDVNNFALERALGIILKRNAQLKTSALLNLDLNLSSLIVVQDGKLIYSHDETFDGVRLMKQMSELPKDSPNYIEMLKERLSAHLRHTMHFFYSSRPHVSIDKLMVSGDCAVIEKLTEYIQQEVGLETEIADPFMDMNISSAVNKEEIKKQAPTLMLCCGLALSSVK